MISENVAKKQRECDRLLHNIYICWIVKRYGK